MNEIEAARCLLESQDDQAILGRPLIECGLIRFHQQRKFALDCTRLFLEIADLDEEEEEADAMEGIRIYATNTILDGTKQLIPKCVAAMAHIRAWLQKISDKLAAASMLMGVKAGKLTEEMETIEFSRVGLVIQHEALAVILGRAIEKKKADSNDFKSFLQLLKTVDKYDILLGKHLFTILYLFHAKRLASSPLPCSWRVYKRIRLDRRKWRYSQS
jgi:nuclear pore complex protein Nup205